MSERAGRIAVRLALATFGVALEMSVVRAGPSAGPAASVGDGAAASAAAAAPRIKSNPLASAGKPVAPISIGYELATQPVLGVPFDVRISVRGSDGVADLTLMVRAGDGVQAGTPQLTASSADGAQRTWTVAATAYGEGALYLGVLAQGTVGNQHPARYLRIPIRIGATTVAAPTTVSPPKNGFSGQRVIVLPADGVR